MKLDDWAQYSGNPTARDTAPVTKRHQSIMVSSMRPGVTERNRWSSRSVESIHVCHVTGNGKVHLNSYAWTMQPKEPAACQIGQISRAGNCNPVDQTCSCLIVLHCSCKHASIE